MSMTEFFLEKTFEEIIALRQDLKKIKEQLYQMERMPERVEWIHKSIQNIGLEQIKKQDEILDVLEQISHRLGDIQKALADKNK